MKKIFKMQKTLKDVSCFSVLLGKWTIQDYRRNSHFLIKNLEKKILKQTYSYSARRALSNHVKKNEKYLILIDFFII